MKNFILLIIVLFFGITIEGQNRSEIDSLKQELNVAHNDTVHSKILLSISLKLNATEPDSSILYGEKSLKFAKKIAFEKVIGKSFFSIGLTYFYMGNYTKAISYFQDAGKIFEKMKDKGLSANVFMNVALSYQNMSKLTEAIQYYYKALKLFEETENSNGQAIVLGNIGNIHSNNGDYIKALEFYYKALKIDLKANINEGLIRDYGNIGSVYTEFGLKSKKTNDTVRAKIQLDSALVYINKSLKLSQESGRAQNAEMALGNMANVYFQMGNYEKSLEIYYKAIEEAKNINDLEGVARWKHNIGWIYANAGKYKEAEAIIIEALKIVNETGNLLMLETFNKNLSEVYTEMGNFKEALKFYKESIKIRDSLFNVDNARKQTEAEMNFEFQKKEEAAKQEKERQAWLKNIFIGGFIAMFLIVVLIFRGYRIKQKSNKEISKQKELVEIKNREITDSIHYAKRIQSALLASSDFLNKYIPQNFIFYKPKDIVSGDFYWATSKMINNSNWFFICIADSTGHGVPGAFMSLLNISFLNEAITEREIWRPDIILDHVRSRLIESLNSQETEGGGKDGMDCSLLAFNFSERKLFAACANNSLLLIRNNELIKYQADRMPVGKSPKDRIPFSLHEIDLKHGDLFYAFTDGYADQFGGPSGKKLMNKTLINTLKDNSNLSVSEIHSRLKIKLEDWQGKNEQIDDILIVGIKIL